MRFDVRYNGLWLFMALTLGCAQATRLTGNLTGDSSQSSSSTSTSAPTPTPNPTSNPSPVPTPKSTPTPTPNPTPTPTPNPTSNPLPSPSPSGNGPNISSVSGVLTKGSPMVISGSNFGSHGNYNNISDSWGANSFINFRFHDFENGQLSSHGFFQQTQSGKDLPASEMGIAPGGPMNSTKYMNRTYGSQDGEANGLSTEVAGAGNQFYTTFKFMMPSLLNAGKFFRMYFDLGDIFLASNCENAQIRGAVDPSADTEYGSGASMAYGKWSRIEVWADATTNTFRVTTNGQPGFSKTNWLPSSLGLNAHTIDYPNMVDAPSRNSSCGGGGVYNYDDIFIDFTQARVEISDSPTWAGTIKKEIQIPVSWTSTAIKFSLNPGEFSGSSQVYLYVIDSNGKVNSNGYKLILGSTLP